MKNFKRRLLSSLALVLILILSTTVLSGCYVTRSAKMKYVEGTYELTTYSGDENWLEERGIKLIMVIRADGTGYYGYRDNNTEPFISELRCRFTADPEEPGKYQFVEIDFEGNGEYHQLGINARWNNKNLNSQKPQWKGNLFEGTAEIDYYIHVDFTRISKATDRSVLDEHFSGAPVLPFGIIQYNGTYQFKALAGGVYPDIEGYVPKSPVIYFYVDLNFANSTGKAYYMLKSDNVAKEEEFELSALRTDSGEILLRLGEREAKIVDEYLYNKHLHIPRVDTEYFQFDYIGTHSDETIAAYAENDHITYIANMYDGIYEYTGIMYKGSDELITLEELYVYYYWKIDIRAGKATFWGMSTEQEEHVERTADLTFTYDKNGKLMFTINSLLFEVSSLSENGKKILKNAVYPEWDDIYTYRGHLTDEQLQQQIDEKYESYINNKSEE